MTSLRQAAQQALEAMESAEVDPHSSDAVYKAITDLRAALAEPQIDPVDEYRKGFIAGQIDMRDREQAEPVQEPVAWRFQSAVGGWAYGSQPPLGSKYPVYPLYTAPPQRKPLSLTDLQEALVYTNLIDRDAIDDPDGYDEGSTLAQIDELHRVITGDNT